MRFDDRDVPRRGDTRAQGARRRRRLSRLHRAMAAGLLAAAALLGLGPLLW